MRTILLALAFAVFITFDLGCEPHSDRQPAAAQATPSAGDDSRLLVTIEPNPSFTLDEPLKMRWRIFNSGVKPKYVYSTLLRPENGALAEINIDAEHRLLEVRFLRLNTFPRDISPNSFPDTEFKRIDPGQSYDGYFVSSKPARHISNTKITNTSPLHEAVTGRLTTGTWELRTLVAYGDEIESVQSDLKTLYPYSKGHPLAAIVKWQKVAYSETVRVIFQE